MAKSNAGVQKVGSQVKPDAEKKEEKAKKGKKSRIDFPMKSAMCLDKDGNVVTAINAENLLIAVPGSIIEGDKVVYAGYDLRQHNPLKKTDFASMATYLMYNGFVARARANRLIKIAEDKEATAARLLKFGDEQTRKKAAKIAKMRDQLAALEQQLIAEGIDVKDI